MLNWRDSFLSEDGMFKRSSSWTDNYFPWPSSCQWKKWVAHKYYNLTVGIVIKVLFSVWIFINVEKFMTLFELRYVGKCNCWKVQKKKNTQEDVSNVQAEQKVLFYNYSSFYHFMLMYSNLFHVL